jgi:hypothetical protein
MVYDRKAVSINDGETSAVELREYFGSIGEYMSHEEAQDGSIWRPGSWV